MPLASPDTVRGLLISPCCRARLEGLACVECRTTFPEVDGKPVLVDFTDSILDRDQVLASRASSPVRRRRSFRLRQRLQPTSEEASANNVASLMSFAPAAPRVLVVGGGTVGEGLDAFYASDAEVVGFDIYASDQVQVVADAHHIPFADGSFDAAIVQAVLEHVLSPEQVVAEIWRVLRDDGLVYAETPFLQPVHEGPYDFTRFTESGHRWLFRRFTRLDSGVVGGPGTALLWSVNHFTRATFRSRVAGLVARTLLLPLWLFDRWMSPPHALDAAAGVYFLGRRADTDQVSPRDMVSYYRGAQA